MTEKFNPLHHWIYHYELARNSAVVAQKEVHRLLGAAGLNNVLVVDFSQPKDVA